ncbi:MAG: hypothetical protein ABDH28_00665 [Brevinematia bacterium]
MKIPVLVKSIILLGRINLSLATVISLLILILSSSIILTIFDFNSEIPSIILVILVIILLLFALVLLEVRLVKSFTFSCGRLETLLFSKRRFLLDSIMEAYNKQKSINIEEEKDLKRKLKDNLVIQIRWIALLSLFLMFLTILLATEGSNGIRELYNFINSDIEVNYNRYISSDIPLRVEVKPNFRGDFFVHSESITKLTPTGKGFTAEVFTSSSNAVLLARKYGILKKIKLLSLRYLTEFSLLSQNVEVFFGSLKLSSYEYIPTLELVKGSKVFIHLDFSQDVSNVSFSRNYGIKWTKKDKSNSIVIFLVANTPKKFSIEAMDNFGRKLRIEEIELRIVTNDIPLVSIKYPEKDLTLVSRFVLEGYGEITDNHTIVDSWLDISVSNSLTGITKKIQSLRGEGRGIAFSYKEGFSFTLDSFIAGFLPGDNIKITVYAKDIYGAVGNASRSIYLPTFSEITRMMNEEINEKKKDTSSWKEELLQLKYDVTRNKVSFSQLIDKLQSLRSFITNISEFSEKAREIYEQLDRTKSLIDEFKKLEDISTKLENILNDKEFRKIVETLMREKDNNQHQALRKIDELTKAITELDMEINRLSELRDIIRSISQTREIESSLYEGIDRNDMGEFNRKVEEFLKSEEFQKMSGEFRSSFLEKIRQIDKLLKENKKNTKENFSEIFKNIDFEIFKEAMRQLSQMQKKQREKFWEIYFGVLSSQISLTKAKKEIDKLGLKIPRINLEHIKDEFKIVSDSVKNFRLTMRDFLDNFSLEPSLSEIFSEIEYNVMEIEKDFNFFTDAVSSGVTYYVSQNIANMIGRTSSVLSKLLELLESMDKNINISPSGVSLSEIMEMYNQILKMMSQALEEKTSEEILSNLEKLLGKAIQKARELEAKSPGDGMAREIRERLEEILDKIKKGELLLANTKAKELEFNMLEYQRGMFEKGISEKREAERPKEYKAPKVENVINVQRKVYIRDPFIHSKYLEVLNNYRKMISEREINR